MYDTDEIKLEVDLHREFKERLTRYFKGRDEILSTIDNYLKNAGERRIMTIIGASGSGKSSVMAKAVKHQEDKSAIIISRFIGATSRSSNLMSLLQGLCGQIAKKYGADAKTMARQGDEKAWYDINGLAEILRKCLELATAEKPLLVFLDSLDQLAETDNAKALYWLPRELPGHCRFIVSSLPELESRLNGTVVEHLSVMPEREAREVLNAWFGSIKRKLTESQHQLVIDSFNKVELPIYLRLAYEKSKNWHSYDGEHTLKPDVSGIIKEYFKDLEDSHPEGFVENVVCYLLSGRYQGLAESEILEILAFDPEYWEIFKAESHEDHRQELQDLKDFLEKPKDGQRGYMKIPIVVWSRLYLDLEPFLTERDADGVPIITFFHRQFNNVLGEKYGLTKEETTTGV